MTKKTDTNPIDGNKEIKFDIGIIDPGYSNFKIARLSTKDKKYVTTIQPSIISEVPEWQSKYLEGIGFSACVEWRNKKYLVGYLALMYGFSVPSFVPGWMENLACPLFALSFCREADELYIMLSPADWDKKEKIQSNLTEAGFKKINFAPQGIGIWLDVGCPKNSVVIDIGYNTVDVLFTIDGKPIRELCFALRECGLVSFLEKLTKDDPIRLARRLEEGDPDLREKAKNYYYPWLLQKLDSRSEWRKRSPKQILVFGGGGARFLPDNIPEKHVIPKNPELANVRGFVKYLIKQLETKPEEKSETETTSTTSTEKEQITQEI